MSLFRRPKPQAPPPPPCPRCEGHTLVTIELRESVSGVAGHFYCPVCSITTHAFVASPDRPRVRWVRV